MLATGNSMLNAIDFSSPTNLHYDNNYCFAKYQPHCIDSLAEKLRSHQTLADTISNHLTPVKNGEF